MKDTGKKIMAQAGPFLGLMVVIALFSIPTETREFFLTYHNFKTIFTQTVIVAIGALGMTLIIVSGGIDLSVGSSIAFTSVVGAMLIQKGWGPVPALLAMIASGGLIGLLNGAAIAALRLVPFIITLGTLGVARGSAKWLADNQTVNYESSPINTWMTTTDPFSYALPAGVWVALGLAIATSLLLRNTVFGRHVFALGSNEATARLCGIPVTRLKIGIYALAGCFFGLAGLFQLARLRQGDPTVAVGLELDIIAAVIIGGASLSGGIGTVLGSMIGALIMAVLRNGSQQMGWPTYFQEIIIGLVIIVAVFVDRLRQGRQS
ncbi:ABC transporter permease [Horticoccus sp. 23ND18S-11]|uniref:ABC transporter permease n=1 Tax=Horticoccus sp. 23ND18S-11 TaxID=3391832 RepID=UPI0039C9C439